MQVSTRVNRVSNIASALLEVVKEGAMVVSRGIDRVCIERGECKGGGTYWDSRVV